MRQIMLTFKFEGISLEQHYFTSNQLFKSQGLKTLAFLFAFWHNLKLCEYLKNSFNSFKI